MQNPSLFQNSNSSKSLHTFQKPQFQDIQQRMRLQIRRKKIEMTNKDRMTNLLQKHGSQIYQFIIIQPLTKYSTLPQLDLQNTLRVLKQQISNKQVFGKLKDMQFEQSLMKILKQTKLIQYKNIVIECISKLCQVYEQSWLRILLLDIQIWIVQQLAGFQLKANNTDYLINISKLVMNICSRKGNNQKIINYLLQYKYFKSIFDKFNECLKENKQPHPQSTSQLFQYIFSTLYYLLQYHKLSKQDIIQILNTLPFNHNQIQITRSHKVILFLTSILNSKLISPVQFKQFIQLESICGIVISNMINPELNQKRDNYYQIIKQQMYSDQYKTHFIQLISIGYQQHILDNSMNIDQLFLQKCLFGTNKNIKQPAIKLFNHILTESIDNRKYKQIINQRFCKMIIQGLSPLNKNLLSYLQISYNLVLGNYSEEYCYNKLYDLKIFNKLSDILSNPHQKQAEKLLSILNILLIYLRNSKRDKNQGIKKMMDRMRIINLVFKLQDHKNQSVREVSFVLLDQYESWSKYRR